MSILAAASSESGRVQAVFAAVCLAIALLTALALRLWRPGPVPFPERLKWGASAWPLVGVLGAGVFCWWTASSAFLTYKQAELVARMGPDAKLELSALSPRDMAFLATVPPLAAFVVLVGADLALKRTGAYDLGLGLARLKSGVFLGILGSICVVPLLFGLMVGIDWLYRLVHFQHPDEHELLHALGQTKDPLVVVPLMAGAAVIAPLFEEFLFRAHLQTILRRLFTWVAREVFKQGVDVTPAVRDAAPNDLLTRPAADPIVSTPRATTTEAGAVATGPLPVVEYAEPSTKVLDPVSFPDPDPAPAWTAWAAIVVTAALFASVHAMWTWPPIFILALCLGYAYERTGNLWVPILIHASFNAVSTLMFLGGLSN